MTKFWDWIESFHKSDVKDRDSPFEKLASINYLRETFEPNWDESNSDKHPFYSMLSIASDEDYARLGVFVNKIKELSKLPGNADIIRRMGDFNEYYGAYCEMDTALRFKLADLEVSIIEATQEMRTPDFLLKSPRNGIWIETTTINTPKETETNDLIGKLMTISISRHVAISGYFLREPKQKEIAEVIKMIQEALKESSSADHPSKLSIPGLMILFLRFGPSKEGIPEQFLDGVDIHDKEKKHRVERIVKKIEDKCKNNYPIAKSGFLIIYDQSAKDGDFIELLKRDERDLVSVISSYRNLLGLAIIMSNVRNPQPIWDLMNLEHCKWDVISLPSLESEGIIVWKNPCADEELPDYLIKALFEFNDNLNKILPDNQKH
jgi:hypothetical protein